MAKFTLEINNARHDIEVGSGTSLLWVLREHLGLTGTKYGCGIAQCGACTIHIHNKPMKACVLQVDDFANGQKLRPLKVCPAKEIIHCKELG